MANGISHTFDAQNNYNYGNTFEAANKAPLIADRVWDTKADAQQFVDNPDSMAVEGLLLSVINDGKNNGVYFVEKVAWIAGEKGVLVKVGSDIVLDSEMSDESTNGVQNKVIKSYVDATDTKLQEDIDDINEWKSTFDEKIEITEDGVRIKGNLVVDGEVAAGGVGEEGTGGGGDIDLDGLVMGIKVSDKGNPIYPDENGIVDISDALNGGVVCDVSKDYVDEEIQKVADSLAQIESDLKETDKSISDEIERVSGDITKVENEISGISQSVADLNESVEGIEEDISTIEDTIIEQGDTLSSVNQWFLEVGQYFKKDDNGIFTDENIRSSGEISAGGVGEEGISLVSGVILSGGEDNIKYPDGSGILDLTNELVKAVNAMDIDKYATRTTFEETTTTITSNITTLSTTKANSDDVYTKEEVDDKLENVVLDLELIDYAKKDDLNALAERVTQTEEKNIEQDNSLNTIKNDLNAIEKWYNEVGSHIHKDEHGVYTTENFRSFGEISAGGVGTESEGGGGEGSTTLDGLMDVEIEDKDLDDFQSNSQVIGYDRQTGIWVNKVTMYKHPQSKAESEWNITHNLGKMPNVKVIDSTGALVHGTVVYDPSDLLNKLTISFGGAFSGTAYLD